MIRVSRSAKMRDDPRPVLIRKVRVNPRPVLIRKIRDDPGLPIRMIRALAQDLESAYTDPAAQEVLWP
ncbi:MAG TPA: hypothetical protein VH701_07475 [Vicinamibacterales bacterium]|jgi:hypothetical protein